MYDVMPTMQFVQGVVMVIASVLLYNLPPLRKGKGRDQALEPADKGTPPPPPPPPLGTGDPAPEN